MAALGVVVSGLMKWGSSSSSESCCFFATFNVSLFRVSSNVTSAPSARSPGTQEEDTDYYIYKLDEEYTVSI